MSKVNRRIDGGQCLHGWQANAEITQCAVNRACAKTSERCNVIAQELAAAHDQPGTRADT